MAFLLAASLGIAYSESEGGCSAARAALRDREAGSAFDQSIEDYIYIYIYNG